MWITKNPGVLMHEDLNTMLRYTVHRQGGLGSAMCWTLDVDRIEDGDEVATYPDFRTAADAKSFAVNLIEAGL